MSVYKIDGSICQNIYSVDGTPLLNAYDVSGNRLFTQFLDTAVITALPSVSASGTKQGGCTDGTHIYQAAGDSTNYTYMTIIKYDIANGTSTVKRFDGTPNFGHANDMAYNPSNGYLYVCTMLDDGSVVVLNSADLSYVSTIYVNDENGDPYRLWQICYDRNSGHFLSAHGDKFLVYDASWNYLSSITAASHPNATAQGCETDGDYIYRVTYNPNYFDVINISNGERVKTINNPMSGEPEALMYDWNGNYYAVRNATDEIFYHVQLKEE